MIVGIIRRKPVLTHAIIVFGGMLASVNSVKYGDAEKKRSGREVRGLRPERESMVGKICERGRS